MIPGSGTWAGLEIAAVAAVLAVVSTVGFSSLNAASATAFRTSQDIGIPVGSVAPPAALEKLDGTKVDLADYYGKQPVFIEFWASWCENCKALEPAIKSAVGKYGSKMKFVGVAVTVNQSLARVKAYVAQYKLPMEMLWDVNGKATGAFEVPATSYIVIINKEGKVAYGGLGSGQKLDEAIRKVVE
jgi:thiol-disulfide isomerase/thioredoxin